jgi:dienelactone hydrolase
MIRRAVAAVLLGGAMLGAAVAPIGATTRATSPPPVTVRHLTLTFVDRSRPTEDPSSLRSAPTRTLVTEIYLPRGKGPFPLVVFAHGNAGHPLKFGQLHSSWARAGSVVAAPAFPLTNDRDPGPSVIGDFVHQPADVSFVIDRVLAASRRRGSPLEHRVDARHIGLAGHSLGGATVYGLRASSCCRDRRIDAVVLMDPARPPFPGKDRPVAGPVLFIHIQGDPVVPYAPTKAQYQAASAPKYLMTLSQGIHFEPYEDAPSPHDAAVVAATTQFWDAFLRGDRRAARRVVTAGTEAGLSTVEAQLR